MVCPVICFTLKEARITNTKSLSTEDHTVWSSFLDTIEGPFFHLEQNSNPTGERLTHTGRKANTELGSSFRFSLSLSLFFLSLALFFLSFFSLFLSSSNSDSHQEERESPCLGEKSYLAFHSAIFGCISSFSMLLSLSLSLSRSLTS